jgi:hypothetical protein
MNEKISLTEDPHTYSLDDFEEIIITPDDKGIIRIYGDISQGPGGQNVNRNKTKAVVEFDINASDAVPESSKEKIWQCLGETKEGNEAFRRLCNIVRVNEKGKLLITLGSQDSKSYQQNQKLVLEKLSKLLTVALASEKERKTKIPKAVKAKRRAQGMRAKQVKYKQQKQGKGF